MTGAMTQAALSLLWTIQTLMPTPHLREAAPLLQGDQVQDHQEAGLGALSPPGPLQAFWASSRTRRMRARVGQG